VITLVVFLAVANEDVVLDTWFQFLNFGHTENRGRRRIGSLAGHAGLAGLGTK
jgi:hypothetical protein